MSDSRPKATEEERKQPIELRVPKEYLTSETWDWVVLTLPEAAAREYLDELRRKLERRKP